VLIGHEEGHQTSVKINLAPRIPEGSSPEICRELQGSCASLEFKARHEKSLNFRKLRKSLDCFGKRMEGLEKFGICLSWWLVELLRPFRL